MKHQIEAKLREIRECLLTGRYAEMETIANSFPSDEEIGRSLSAPELSLMKELAVQNRKCLAAAIQGLQSGRIRFHEIQRTASGLSTYNRSGQVEWVRLKTGETVRI